MRLVVTYELVADDGLVTERMTTSDVLGEPCECQSEPREIEFHTRTTYPSATVDKYTVICTCERCGATYEV